jgi:hypothetical protein
MVNSICKHVETLQFKSPVVQIADCWKKVLADFLQNIRGTLPAKDRRTLTSTNNQQKL